MNSGHSVVLIDDDILVLQALRDQLQPTFPELIFETCQSGEEAIDLVHTILSEGGVVAAVISDHLMNGMTGSELLIELQEVVPKARKIMLTGQAGLDAVSKAVNAGALYRYISKPWDAEDMRMTLHEALLAYRTDTKLEQRNAELEQLNSQLEEVIKQRTRELFDRNSELEEGLEYAGHVQQALFPVFDQLCGNVRVREIFLRPFNRVSGDFYWMSEADADGRVFLAVGDCTGHGIAGAFMSVMHVAALNEAIYRCKERTPQAMLHYMNTRIKDLTDNTYRLHRTHIGAETVILALGPGCQNIQFASNSKGLILRDLVTGEVKEPLRVHKRMDKDDQSNVLFGQVDLTRPTNIYLFTDGVVDQFGGPKGKKFKRSGLRDWIMQQPAVSNGAGSFGDFFLQFSEGNLPIDDALMMILEFNLSENEVT